MPDITAFPIPSTSIGSQSAAVRTAINVYSKLETYSQAEVDAFFFNRAPDADVNAYIAAVEALLPSNSIETALPNAINPKHKIYNFVTAEKAAGRWALHKRIYLPIYNNSAANAVDMVSLTSGTFIGGVTHSAGYIQGDGTSGYFDTITPWQSLVALDSATIGTLNYAQNTSFNMTSFGIGQFVATSIGVGSDNSTQLGRAIWAGANAILPVDPTNLTRGIQIASRFGGVTRITKRLSSGVVEATNSAATTGAVSNGPLYMMARNSISTPVQFSTAQIGAGIISAGMGSTAIASYSLNLKTLWESLTGLTLP